MPPTTPNEGINVLVVESNADIAALIGESLAARVPGVQVIDSEPDSPVRGDAPDLILWNIEDDSPERIGALGLFLQTRPEAPTVVIVPERAAGLVGVAIQAGASDAVVRSPGYMDQLAAVVIKHTVLRGAPDRRRSSDLRQVREAVAEMREENRTLREMVSQLRDAANTDPLTGLGNARALQSRLDELFGASVRYGTDLACLVLDLDGLKAVNDALGHRAGDDLLRTTAEVIRQCTRRSDAAARAGGDEFVILLPHTSAERARLLAQRLQRELAVRTAHLSARLGGSRPRLRLAGEDSGETEDGWTNGDDRRSAPVGVSIGVACVGEDAAHTARDLVDMADGAMYKAKRRGRGRVEVSAGSLRAA